jgi:hypothetical protein
MSSTRVKIVAVGAQIARAGGLGPRTAWRGSVVDVDDQVAARLVAEGAAVETGERVRAAGPFEPDEATHPQLQPDGDEPVFDDESADEDASGLDRMTVQELRAHARKNNTTIPAGVTAKADIIEHLRGEGL